MTLDEAIRHCEDVVEEKESICNVIENEGETWTDSGKTYYDILKKCGEEHRQLAKWLKELKQLREQTWSLDDAREDFMSDVYNTLDFLPTNDEANRIIGSFDRVTSGIRQEQCTVTEFADRCRECGDKYGKMMKPKKGRWIKWYEQKIRYRCVENIPHCKCSACDKEYDSHASQFVKYCPNCGAEMERSEEE